MIRTTAIALLASVCCNAFAADAASGKQDLEKARKIAETVCVACHAADGNSGIAEIYIQSSPRENAVDLKPLKREFIRFTVDRNENPFITAYKEAKKVTTETVMKDGKEEKVEFKAPFADWTDDII